MLVVIIKDNEMTAMQLSNKLCKEYDIHNPHKWPRTYVVDYRTYANVCQNYFHYSHTIGEPRFVSVALGPNGGILFHSVELIMKVK